MVRGSWIVPFALVLPLASASAGPDEQAIQRILGLAETPATSPYIQVERDGSNVRGIIAQVMSFPAEHVLNDVILCYGAYPRWFPLQTEARYLDADVSDYSGAIYGAYSFPWPIGTRDFEANIVGSLDESVQPAAYRIDFKHRPGTGNIATMFGHWLLQPSGTRTVVVYDATIDFDTWVPSFLMARGTQQFLPAIMERMATRADRCPAALRPPDGADRIVE